MIIKNNSDFDKDLINHIKKVKEYINIFIKELLFRSNNHDNSKLKEPEYSVYKKYTGLLDNEEYGSKKYHEICKTKEFSDICDHHCSINPHHPEHYDEGIDGMTLVDLIEMLCDWKSASERHQNASWQDGFDINCDRFKIDKQLRNILVNTYNKYIKKDNK